MFGFLVFWIFGVSRYLDFWFFGFLVFWIFGPSVREAYIPKPLTLTLIERLGVSMAQSSAGPGHSPQVEIQTLPHLPLNPKPTTLTTEP